jgi:hypothetical protein
MGNRDVILHSNYTDESWGASLGDACSRCNGRGTIYGCKQCGKKVPETNNT